LKETFQALKEEASSCIILLMDKVGMLIALEEKRQAETINLIPSENYPSVAVRRAVGSVLMNKYSEGYPGRRYYQGNEYIDEIENLAIERAKKLFGVPRANVQPYSGSPANAAVYFALLDPGDTILGMSLAAGGHLTHGHPKITFSGKYFNSVQYNLGKDGIIDYDEIERLAKKHKPKLIIAGITAYSRTLDWERFAQIADLAGAYLLADISHIAGLVATATHPSPKNHAHLITTTTHKTLRGPRGAIIMTTKKGIAKDASLPGKIDKAVFPGLQGGPHNNQTAAVAIALRQAQGKSFKNYINQVLKNASALAKELQKYNFNIVSGGTDNHMFLVDLRNKGILGKDFAIALEKAGIVVNYNAIPNDPNPPMNPSGIRVGTPAITTQGMGREEMKQIAVWFNEVAGDLDDMKVLLKIKSEVGTACRRFPLI